MKSPVSAPASLRGNRAKAFLCGSDDVLRKAEAPGGRGDVDKSARVSFFDLLLILVLCTSISSIMLLVLGRFDAVPALIIGTILTVLSVRFLNVKIAGDESLGWGIVLILLLSLLFRATPYPHISGGWDPGVYVAMSSYYENEGSTFVVDDVRQSLSPLQKEFYDRENHYVKYNALTPGLRGSYEGKHHPGIYMSSLDESKYVFQFYPLHPLWMAIFGKFAGIESGSVSLIFFSLISVVAFYLLALEVSNGDKPAAYLIAFFLAINPAHVYFSRYPVAEMVVLAFSSASLYCLARYYRTSLAGGTGIHYLLCSAGLIGCLFFTKISGFMYMPFYYCLLLGSVLFMPAGRSRNRLFAFLAGVFALYGLSVLYGLAFSYPYSDDIHSYSFRKLFGYHWRTYLSVLVFSLILFPVSLALAKKGKMREYIRNAALFFSNHLAYILGIVICAGVYQGISNRIHRPTGAPLRKNRRRIRPGMGIDQIYQYLSRGILSVSRGVCSFLHFPAPIRRAP